MDLKSKYRPDIDGLRAIAVLSVVFYHAGMGIFSGGFVGVDVFFVISGYLIGKILINEIYTGQFSLAKFYERRVRRIFPALFATLGFTIIVSIFLFDSYVFFEFSKSLLATTFFLSNVLFWTESGYFDAPSHLKPLLHTWSLSVEEQFYIFFPLLILVIFRFFKNKLKLTLLITALISFILSVYLIQREPSATFYLAPLRAWELLIGGILAANIIPTNIKSHYRNLLCILGITMILICVFTYTDSTTFPGISATLPTFGAALIIYSGIEGNIFTTQILGAQPFAFIGQISYSLYLLHWPIIVFGRYYIIRNVTVTDSIFWLLIIFLLSTLSWKYVETPLRSMAFLSRSTIFKLAGTGMCLSTLVGTAIYIYNGLPQRFDKQDFNIAHISDPGKKWGKCERVDMSKAVDLCSIGAKTEKASFLVWGDSHAEALAPAINKSAKGQEEGGLIVFNYGCPPLLGANRLNCSEYNNAILNYIENHPELKTIMLISRWANQAEGTPYKPQGETDLASLDSPSTEAASNPNRILFDQGLNQTVNKLAELNRNIVFVTQVPEVGYYVPSAYLMAIRTNRDINSIIAPALQDYLNRNNFVIATINAIKEKYDNVYIIDTSEALCNKKTCLVALDNVPLYRDDNHLSSYGSLSISYIFDPLFENISAPKNP